MFLGWSMLWKISIFILLLFFQLSELVFEGIKQNSKLLLKGKKTHLFFLQCLELIVSQTVISGHKTVAASLYEILKWNKSVLLYRWASINL